jgi:hypothetical protein
MFKDNSCVEEVNKPEKLVLDRKIQIVNVSTATTLATEEKLVKKYRKNG